MIRQNRNKTAVLLYCGIFAFFLVINILTPYIADDFRYFYSFNDKTQRIESLSQVLLSMRAHRYNMNGRLVAHTLVQILGMLPGWVFDGINAAMFVLQLALLNKLGRQEAPRSNLLLLGLFCGFWMFCPAFSQVNLWQDGSCNYLWSTVFALLYLQYFVREYMSGQSTGTKLDKFCFLCLSFGMGAYSETASSAAIFMAMLLVFLMLLEKRKCSPFWLVSLTIACFGYLTIYLAPAQMREKGAEMTIPTLTANLVTVARYYWMLFGLLLCAFAAALILNLLIRTDRKRILLALVFFAGSLAANFIMMFAQYYTERSACGAFVYLMAAIVILLYPLLGIRKYKALLALGLAILILVSIPALFAGTADIYSTCQQIRQNEAYIYECRDNGILDIQLPMIVTTTPYSAAYSCKYLDTEDASIWPNYSMSYYYGVNSIIGVYPE